MPSATEATQPRSPFRDRPPTQPPAYSEEPPEESGGPGCLVWGIVGLISLGCALTIVLLAGTAGWTTGVRVAQVTATAAIGATAESQLIHIPEDIANKNAFMVGKRVEYLGTLLPDMPELPGLIQTATAIYNDTLPTTTPSPTLTLTPAPTQVIPTAVSSEVPVEVPQTAGGYDLDSLLQQARDLMAQQAWADAIEILDVIIAIDSNYQSATVDGLMLEALRAEALRLYNEELLAEAILTTTRAESFGLSAEDGLRYERYVAELYLDAARTEGIDYATSIQALRKVYDLGPGRYYDEAARKLFSQYVAYGDAWALEGNQCNAYTQYENALTIRNSADLAVKRDNAHTLCLQATTTPGTDGSGEPATIAPVGQVGGN